MLVTQHAGQGWYEFVPGVHSQEQRAFTFQEWPVAGRAEQVVQPQAKAPASGDPCSIGDAEPTGQRDYHAHSNLSESALSAVLHKKMLLLQEQGVSKAWLNRYLDGWYKAALAKEPERHAAQKSRELATHMGSFGTFLKFVRTRDDVRQGEVALAMPENHRLSGRRMYGAIERNEAFPLFEELALLCTGLYQAGVEITAEERAAYLLVARKRIEERQRGERITPKQWEGLARELESIHDATRFRKLGGAAWTM